MPSLKSLIREFGRTSSRSALPPFPSDKIQLATNTSEYTAPSDGYLVAFSWAAASGAIGWYCHHSESDGEPRLRSAMVHESQRPSCIYLPMRKGQKATRDGDASEELYFVPLDTGA